MKAQAIFIAHPQTSAQASALKAFMEANNIKFEVAQDDGYNPDFVEKILKSKQQIAQGAYTEVRPEDIKGFLDSL
jgi:hypothetical protein